MIRGRPRDFIRARHDAAIGFASGELDSPRTGCTDMIDRVRAIAGAAAALIDDAAEP